MKGFYLNFILFFSLIVEIAIYGNVSHEEYLNHGYDMVDSGFYRNYAE